MHKELQMQVIAKALAVTANTQMLTISLMASKASVSPFLAAAQARAGVSAFRMASSSYGHQS